jgi:hypothetical protein
VAEDAEIQHAQAFAVARFLNTEIGQETGQPPDASAGRQSKHGGEPSLHMGCQVADLPDDLQAVVLAWSCLPVGVRVGIVSLIAATTFVSRTTGVPCDDQEPR